MLKFALRRLGTGIILLFAVSFVAFLFLHLGSGGIARNILGVNATQDDVVRLTQELGLDRPFFEQYWNWLISAVQLDLGEAWTRPLPVTDLVSERITVTLTLVLLTTIVSGIIAFALGIFAAVRGGWIDRTVQVVGLVGFAVPGFIIAFFLVTVFAIQYPIFRAVGYVPPTEDLGEFIKSVTLPVIALSLGSIAAVSGQVRGAVKDALESDYVRTLRARGLSPRSVTLKHILRNASGPALAVLGVQFIGLLGGAIIIEQMFAIPGLGPFAILATTKSDVPSVMGLVMFTAVVVVLVNLMFDLIAAALNPKIRVSNV